MLQDQRTTRAISTFDNGCTNTYSLSRRRHSQLGTPKCHSELFVSTEPRSLYNSTARFHTETTTRLHIYCTVNSGLEKLRFLFKNSNRDLFKQSTHTKTTPVNVVNSSLSASVTYCVRWAVGEKTGGAPSPSVDPCLRSWKRTVWPCQLRRHSSGKPLYYKTTKEATHHHQIA